MSLLDYFKILSKIFYFTGLAPVVTLEGKPSKIVFIISMVVSLLLNIGLLVASVNFHSYKRYGNIERIANYAFIGSLVVSNLSANVQCYFYSSVYKKILCQILKTENNFETKFSESIHFQHFASRYKMKIFAVIVLHLIDSTLKFWEAWLQDDSNLILKYSFSFFTQSISALITFHVLLYISIVRMFISELNRHISNAPVCIYASGKIEFLKTIKFIHMETWKLMVQINKFFSFNLPFHLVTSAVQTTYYCYWLFLILQVEWNLLYIIRKNIFTKFIIICDLFVTHKT